MPSVEPQRRVPFWGLEHKFGRPEVREAVLGVLDSCRFVGGAEVTRFEEGFAQVCGVKHAIGLNSGTDALFLALKVLGVGPGDEVITATNSYVASAGAVAMTGATPRLADVGPDYLIDPGSVAAAMNERTKVVIPVHLTGAPVDMDALREVTGELPLIEDAAQAVGATWRGRPVGSLGRMAAFSLHPLKHLCVAGDGGMLTTDDDALAERLRRLRNHGLEGRNDCLEFGYNSRLDAIQAAVGNVLLRDLPASLRRRNELALLYDELLAPFAPRVRTPLRREGAESAFYTYVVLAEDCSELRAHLEAEGVETKIHYPTPIHLQPAAAHLELGSYPVAEQQAREQVSLPLQPHLTRDDVEYVVASIERFYAARP